MYDPHKGKAFTESEQDVGTGVAPGALEEQEFIFLVDQSPQMYLGAKPIIMVRDALKLLFHSIPEGSSFNIGCFGIQHHFVAKSSSVSLDQATFEQGIEYIESFYGARQ